VVSFRSSGSFILQKFYEDVLTGIRNRAFPGTDKGRFNIVVAEEKRKPKSIVGAVMVQSYNIVEALEKGIIGFTMFDDIKEDHEVVVVHAIAVLNRLRRQNIGTDLFYAGVRSIAADPRVQAVCGSFHRVVQCFGSRTRPQTQCR
jgi:ribosomal protein S18 acetylase RimI-like enzyme